LMMRVKFCLWRSQRKGYRV